MIELAETEEPAKPKLPDPKLYRSTMGVCLGFRFGFSTAIVVLSCRRDDPTRKLYVTYEWEERHCSMDDAAAALAFARKTYHTVLTVGFHGGRDDQNVFQTLSMRLGHYLEPSPQDDIVALKLVIDDMRSGRLKFRPDSLVARDARAAVWRDSSPDQTGVLVALKCAHWGSQKYRQRLKPVLTGAQKTAAMARARRRKVEAPF